MSITNWETEVHGHYTCHLRSLSQEQDLGKQYTFLHPARAGMRKSKYPEVEEIKASGDRLHCCLLSLQPAPCSAD